MAICRNAARWIACVAIASLVTFGTANLQAQRFVEPGFRSYPLRAAAPAAVEDSLRRFLADRISAGEPIEIVSDSRSRRLLVRGSQEVQQLVDQFIQATDRPDARDAVAQVAQAPRVVHGYPASSVDELNERANRLRQQFANRNDVRIAADERTRQIVVHAPAEVHQQIAASWNGQPAAAQLPPQPPENRRPVRNQAPADKRAPGARQQIQLKNISWKDLVRGLGSVQGQSAALSAPQDGLLEMNLAPESADPARLQIDQQNQVVQISGSTAAIKQWTRVVQALDRRPANPGEQQAMGRLGDAQAETITRTITMLGGAGGTPQGAQWGGEVVQRMFSPDQREPIRVAQLPSDAAAAGQGSDAAAMLITGDSAGSFLGPVRIEFLEGTDIFIVRGQKRDVDRVMKIIQDIERLTKDTEPAVEVVQLKHANSIAVAQLINELNEAVLSARQGDISVTPLVKPNALLLIGRPAGVESVKKIIEKLDVEVDPSTQFRVFLLKYLPAVDAEKTINNLYNVQQQTTTTTGEEPTGLKIRVRAVADFRSNAIVVQGSPRDLEEIGELLDQIDIEGSATVSEVRVFQLKNSLAEDVADVLNNTLGTDESEQANQQGGFQQGGSGAGGTANTQPFSSRRALMLELKVLDEEQKKLLERDILESGILSNVVVSPNIRANSVIVTAPKDSMELIAEIIRQLDELAPQEAEIRVFTIVNGDAASLIEMLTTLFEQDDQQDGPLLQSAAGTGESALVPLRFALDGRTNTIIASGNAADLVVVESILLKLDASDVSRRQTTVYELQIQQAQSVADAITNFVQLRRAALQGIQADAITTYELLEQEVVVVAEPDSNKLIISATEQYFDDIMDVVKKLDKRPDMVMVQCLIAEVALDSTEQLGVELGIQDSLLFNRSIIGEDGETLVPGFNFNNQPLGGAVGPGAGRDQVAGQAIADFALGRTNSNLGYGGLVLSASNESVSVLVRALQEARRLDVLSRPQVMMLNNTTGEVQVGSEVPYVSNSTVVGVNVQNSVTFVNVGLILSVTPRISPDGLVVLDVLANKSKLGSIDDGIPIGSAAGTVIRAPQIDTTRARTFVTARDGQTVILGGLITKTRAASERKVPYLGDVPFFGRLFRTDAVVEERTELLIILTPHIIRDESDIERVNSEEYARMSWCLGHVIETHGDIGPAGGFETILEEDVIYSELTAANGQGTPADATQNAPADATPTPTETWKSLPPQNTSPPVPDAIPDALPQAKKSGVLLNSPQNAALPTNSVNNKRGIERLPATDAQPNYVRPVDFEDNPQATSKTNRSVYRFDDVPFHN